MARATYVPINGDVLAWRWSRAGVDDVELAERCDTSPDVVEEWREGEREPTKTQFGRLVARLRRPASIYFLAEPPELDPAIRAFRSPPGAAQERHLLDAELRAIATAERLQKVARWVREHREETNPRDSAYLDRDADQRRAAGGASVPGLASGGAVVSDLDVAGGEGAAPAP